jgi:hypothetical protein
MYAKTFKWMMALFVIIELASIMPVKAETIIYGNLYHNGHLGTTIAGGGDPSNGFPDFLDGTATNALTTKAWHFGLATNTALNGIAVKGVMGNLAGEITFTGSPSFFNAGAAPNWIGDPQQTAKNYISQPGAFKTDDFHMLVSVVPNQTYSIEILATQPFAPGGPPRNFSVLVGGVTYASEIEVPASLSYSAVYRFEASSATSILDITFAKGTLGGVFDPYPYINALAITPVPEPSAGVMLLGVILGFVAPVIRRRRTLAVR